MAEPDQERVSPLRLDALTVFHVEGAGCAQLAALGGSRDWPPPSAWITMGLWKGKMTPERHQYPQGAQPTAQGEMEGVQHHTGRHKWMGSKEGHPPALCHG